MSIMSSYQLWASTETGLNYLKHAYIYPGICPSRHDIITVSLTQANHPVENLYECAIIQFSWVLPNKKSHNGGITTFLCVMIYYRTYFSNFRDRSTSR